MYVGMRRWIIRQLQPANVGEGRAHAPGKHASERGVMSQDVGGKLKARK